MESTFLSSEIKAFINALKAAMQAEREEKQPKQGKPFHQKGRVHAYICFDMS